FALPRLQVNQSAFSASLLLGILWGFWHIPAYFYRDIYVSMGVLVFFQLLSVIAASVIMTWLYNGTRGSTLMVIIFHGLFDFLSVSEAGGEFAAVFMSALMVFWAVRVYQVYGRESLAPTQKVIYPNV
ncbi:MAG: CPBP family glutamic-type intramembrane protease, partial [Anaerolineales bacterium]